MNGLRSEFGGPQFEPHMTVVGAIKLSEEEARDKFRKGCGEVKKVYGGTIEKFDVGFVYLLLHPTTEVMEASAHCCSCFGYNSTSHKIHILSLNFLAFLCYSHLMLLPFLWLQLLSISVSSRYIIKMRIH